MTVPSVVEAGQEFLVSIAIDKGALEEFSRLQQELPEGMQAIQDNSGSADYSFDNQRVRFIWLKLPAESSINLSYKVKVNERLKGTFTLGGEFSYVENNERKSVKLEGENINITPSPTVTADRQIDVGSYSSVIASEQASTPSGINITCIRQTPYKSKTGNDIMVNLLVYKKDMNKFAKIEEQIPAGFEARSMESREGLFTFKDGIAKFVWMNLPDDPGFTVTYRLIPQDPKSTSVVRITGTLSYIMGGRNVSLDILQQDLDLTGVTGDNVEAFMAALDKGEAKPVAKTTEARVEEVKQPPVKETQPVVKEEKPVVKEEKPVVKEEKPVVKEEKPVVSETPARPVTAGSSRIPDRQRLPVQDGIYYRVQLAAMSNFGDANRKFASYNLSRPVLVEYQNGLYKYTIGSFGSYRQARDFKVTIQSRGIPGAFVVAYRNGRRIDVLDALQATGGR
jgi:hypothetical protein